MTIDCDTLLKMDKDSLIQELDKINPSWYATFASRQALEREAYRHRAFDSRMQDRWTRELKHNALDQMMNALWLLGHAGICLRSKESQQAQEKA